ncbi:hypothetical protein C1646_713521, partial [Rhizophagus diaphanus]
FFYFLSLIIFHLLLLLIIRLPLFSITSFHFPLSLFSLLFTSHHFFLTLITPFRLSSLLFNSHHHFFPSPITPFRLPSLLFSFVSHPFSSPITLFHLPSCPISPFVSYHFITLFYSLSSSITSHYSIVISFFY